MTRALLVLALLGGCRHPTPREDDCAQIRALLERHTLHRRYIEPGQTPSTDDTLVMYDMDALRDLQSRAYRDPEIAAAAKLAGDTSWTIYSPYSTEHDSAIDKLAGMCGLARPARTGRRAR